MALVDLDSCIFVAAFEADGEEATCARTLLERLADTRHLIVTSELTIAELLAPTTRSDVMSVGDRERVYLPLLLEEGQIVDFVPVFREILLRTSALRSAHPQRLPDAIHVATAVSCGCSYFMSSDRDARRLPKALTWVTPVDADVATIIRAANV